MTKREAIAEFLKNRIDLGDAEYEMVTDGYDGNVEAYIRDYEDDFEVVEINGLGYIHRKDYDEYYTVDGERLFSKPEMILEEMKLVKEGQYWTLYIGDLQCGCGRFEDMIEVISEFESPEDAMKYAESCQDFR